MLDTNLSGTSGNAATFQRIIAYADDVTILATQPHDFGVIERASAFTKRHPVQESTYVNLGPWQFPTGRTQQQLWELIISRKSKF
jgi:hypothetical protein